jgi:tetratricopeptide (TPR) repeat protein
MIFHTQGKRNEAIEQFQRAIAIDPMFADPHNELGIAFAEAGHGAEAIEQFQQAIAIDPKNGDAYRNLGTARLVAGRPNEAIEPLKRAVAMDPKLAHGYLLLSQAHQAAGDFREAQRTLRQCLKVVADNDPARASISAQLRQCDHLLELEARVPGILQGNDKAANAAESLELARVCYFKTRFPSAARFFEDAFADQPSLADELEVGNRYNAACAAALAGCGRGEEAGKLTEAERLSWRHQAFGWLRADVGLWKKKLEMDHAGFRVQVKDKLTHWRADPDLEGIRSPNALEKLPVNERGEWSGFWKEVDELLQRAEKQP